MFVISFANPKGGTGKSTTALVVAEQIAIAGLSVTIIDNDPSQNLIHWFETRKGQGRDTNLEIIPKTDPDTFDDILEGLREHVDVVIVDMEGVKDLMASIVTMSSDLVVVPMQASPMDARNAASQLSVIKIAERHLKRAVPYTFVFTRTNATIATKLYRSIRSEMSGMPILDTNVVERAAFKHMHEDGKLLSELDPMEVSGIANARKNAVELTNEILGILKGQQDG